MAWGPEAQRRLFLMYRDGQPEREIVKVLIGEFGCDDKTVRRCVVALDLIHAEFRGASDDNDAGGLRERFERIGGTERYLGDIRRIWSAWTRSQSSSEIDNKLMQSHRDELLPTLLDLREIGAFPLHDYDLAVWQSRLEDPCWPIAKGEICRDLDGGLTVRLHAQQRLQWKYLEQHLADDRVWDAMES